MGLVGHMVGAVRNAWTEYLKEQRLRLDSPEGWGSVFGRESAAGKTVNLETALTLDAVWGCIRANAQAGASMPLQLFRRLPDGSRDRVEDRLAEILGQSPNAWQTGFDFWENVFAWLLASGNAYARKRQFRGRLQGLDLLPASRVARVVKSDGTVVYRAADREGRILELPDDEVLHVRGFGFCGEEGGLSPIRYGVQSMGLGLAADEMAGAMFSNGLHLAGVLSSDSTLNPEQRTQISDNMQKFVGSARAGKMMVLEAGFKFNQVALNPEDAQMLETRRFNVETICRWFGTPPVVVGHAAEGQTMWGTGVEQIILSWLTLGLDPLLDRVEARIWKDILLPLGLRDHYAEFNREALLQMSSEAKAKFLSTMVQNGLMTRNEGRAKLNMRRSGEAAADALTAQTNLAPLDRLGEQPAAASQPPDREEGDNVP